MYCGRYWHATWCVVCAPARRSCSRRRAARFWTRSSTWVTWRRSSGRRRSIRSCGTRRPRTCSRTSTCPRHRPPTPGQWRCCTVTCFCCFCIWKSVDRYCIKSCRINVASEDEILSNRAFNTTIDIKLRSWTDKKLPHKCVEVGMETLQVFLYILASFSKNRVVLLS